jgi:hypothetical protein
VTPPSYDVTDRVDGSAIVTAIGVGAPAVMILGEHPPFDAFRIRVEGSLSTGR